CLTTEHRCCPWLSVPPDGRRPKDRRLPKKRLAVMSGLLSLAGSFAALFLSGILALPDLAGLGGSAAVLAGPAVVPAGSIGQLRSASPDRDAAPGGRRLRAAGNDPSAVSNEPLSAELLSKSGPRTVTAQLPAASGGTVLAGNVGLSFSAKALSALSGPVAVSVDAQPPAGFPGGPAQFSPNGTIVDVNVRDSRGQLVTTFADPVDVLFRYNGADLAMARGDPGVLTAAYVLDAQSPAIENPLHFPVGTWVFFPPSNVKLDTASGTIAVRTQAIGSIMSVVSTSIGYAQTLKPEVRLFSSFDPATSVIFGSKKQFSYLQVLEPQIGSRLLVRDLQSGNVAYVNAADVGPSG